MLAIWELSAVHGEATYLVYEQERYSFARAHEIVSSLAMHLVDLGIVKGDRVALAMRNLPEWVLSFWAAASVGAVVVPLNVWWTGPELAYGLADSGARVLFADGERVERLTPHLTETKVEQVIAVRVEGSLPSGAVAFEDVLQVAGDADRALPVVEIDPDDDATIMYTSGTTGRPKGAVGTNRNIGGHVMNAVYAAQRVAGNEAAPSSAAPAAATLLTFPLFHVGGLHSFLIPYTAAGGKLVLLYKWDTAKALDLIEREDINAVAGVPTTMFELLDEARRQGRPLPSLAGVAFGRDPRTAGTGSPHRPAVRLSRRADQRLRPDGDVRRGGGQHRQRLPRQARQCG